MGINARYLAGRAVMGIATLFVISVVTFVATSAGPGDPARAALGQAATPAQLEAYRAQQHLDEPAVRRYFTWLGDFLHGDWGTSPVYRRSVKEEVTPRIGRSALLGFLAMLLAVPLAFLIGTYTARRSGSRLDVATSSGSLFLIALPEFVIGIFVLTVLAVWLPIFPVESTDVAFGSGVDVALAYMLPALTLALVMAPYITRLVRVNVRDVIRRPFVRSLTLGGLSTRRITWRHVVPNGSLPVIGAIALQMAELVGGLVVVEVLFAFPGIGQLLVTSVLGGDIPTVQAIAMIVGAAFVILNFAADVLLMVVDPRLRT